MPPDRLLGWLAPGLVALFAGLLRIINLSYPAKFVFDETYYPKDAYSLLRFGHEREFVEDAESKILGGNFTQLFDGPTFVAHPPAGKWVIALGEWVFGMNPFGWRIVVALLGTLSVLVIARIVRRMTGSTLLGCVAGLLLALDGLHFVESRIALVDLPMMFWILLALACLLIDRDRMRSRLVDAVAPVTGRVSGYGPALWWRPWRVTAGLCLGIACGTKWSAVFVLAGFGLLTWAWDLGARYAVGAKLLAAGNWLRTLAQTGTAVLSLVGTAALTYIATWTGWLFSSDSYLRTWAEGNSATGLAALVPNGLRSLWHYHSEIMNFHTSLSEDHPYSSHPWGWLIVARPVSFDWNDNIGPQQGCPTDRCIREILGIGTPVLWWAAVLALVVCVIWWLAARDWRFGIPVVGVATTWLPWLYWSDRPIFFFYAVVILPFLVIGLTLVLGMVLGTHRGSVDRRMWGTAAVGGFVLLVVLNFAYFYPILTDQLITYEQWLARMWFNSWV